MIIDSTNLGVGISQEDFGEVEDHRHVLDCRPRCMGECCYEVLGEGPLYVGLCIISRFLFFGFSEHYDYKSAYPVPFPLHGFLQIFARTTARYPDLGPALHPYLQEVPGICTYFDGDTWRTASRRVRISSEPSAITAYTRHASFQLPHMPKTTGLQAIRPLLVRGWQTAYPRL
jgi:hypothetical protein